MPGSYWPFGWWFWLVRRPLQATSLAGLLFAAENSQQSLAIPLVMMSKGSAAMTRPSGNGKEGAASLAWPNPRPEARRTQGSGFSLGAGGIEVPELTSQTVKLAGLWLLYCLLILPVVLRVTLRSGAFARLGSFSQSDNNECRKVNTQCRQDCT